MLSRDGSFFNSQSCTFSAQRKQTLPTWTSCSTGCSIIIIVLLILILVIIINGFIINITITIPIPNFLIIVFILALCMDVSALAEYSPEVAAVVLQKWTASTPGTSARRVFPWCWPQGALTVLSIIIIIIIIMTYISDDLHV